MLLLSIVIIIKVMNKKQRPQTASEQNQLNAQAVESERLKAQLKAI